MLLPLFSITFDCFPSQIVFDVLFYFFLFFLSKVGDVVLVEDESVLENDFKMIGLQTLVGVVLYGLAYTVWM